MGEQTNVEISAISSRTNIVAIVTLIAFYLQWKYELALPMQVHGAVVDLVPVIATVLVSAIVYFRTFARRIIRLF